MPAADPSVIDRCQEIYLAELTSRILVPEGELLALAMSRTGADDFLAYGSLVKLEQSGKIVQLSQSCRVWYTINK